MTELLREQISALVDEELSEAETSLVLKRLAQDDQLRAVYASYQTISVAVRGQVPDLAGPGFAERLRQCIAAEQPGEPVAAAPAARFAPYGRAAGLAAVAASVAVLAVFGLRNSGDSAVPAAPAMAEVQPAAMLADPAPGYVVPASSAAPGPEAARIANYLVSHASFARSAGRPGIMSMRYVGHPVSTPEDEAPPAVDEQDGATR